MEDIMSGGRTRLSVIMSFTVLMLVALSTSVWAKALDGFRDVKLGMEKSKVLEVLRKSPTHFSFDDLGNEIGEIIRGDDLFRYATYRFNEKQLLVEIDLQMREVLGRDRVIELFNSRQGLKLSPLQTTVVENMSIEVKDNALIIRMVPPSPDTRAAKDGPR
jgi:hypothetical protein